MPGHHEVTGGRDTFIPQTPSPHVPEDRGRTPRLPVRRARSDEARSRGGTLLPSPGSAPSAGPVTLNGGPRRGGALIRQRARDQCLVRPELSAPQTSAEGSEGHPRYPKIGSRKQRPCVSLENLAVGEDRPRPSKELESDVPALVLLMLSTGFSHCQGLRR